MSGPIEQWEALAARISIRGTIPIGFYFIKEYYANPYEVYVDIDMQVPDRDTGRPITIAMRHRLLGHPSVELLRAALQRMILHELDENILVDGVRRFDPHAKDVT